MASVVVCCTCLHPQQGGSLGLGRSARCSGMFALALYWGVGTPTPQSATPSTGLRRPRLPSPPPAKSGVLRGWCQRGFSGAPCSASAPSKPSCAPLLRKAGGAPARRSGSFAPALQSPRGASARPRRPHAAAGCPQPPQNPKKIHAKFTSMNGHQSRSNPVTSQAGFFALPGSVVVRG